MIGGVLLSAEAPKTAVDQSVPGLALSVESLDANHPAKDVRSVRLAALYVPRNAPATSFVSAGPFRATFEGDLNMRLRDDLTFSVAGSGSVKLTLNGEMILEKSGDDLAGSASKPVRVKKGKNHLTLQYTSPANGDAWVRLYWASSDFPPEPIPATAFTHSVGSEKLRSATRLREGRELFATLRCLNCHAAAGLSVQRGSITEFSAAGLGHLTMAELQADAPSLAGIGSRLNKNWMVRWISDPRALRADASMPRLLQSSGGQEAADMGAYLASLREAEDPALAEPAAETIAAGGRLFAHLNCVGCHTLPDAGKIDEENRRVPLHYLKAKFRPAALRVFLKSPEKHYAWTRMPDFRFTDVEADRLTGFLLSRPQKTIEVSPAGNVEKGRELVAGKGCLNCHSISNEARSTLKAPALADISKSKLTAGCFAVDETGQHGAPDFSLTDSQRSSLGAFLATDHSSLQTDTLPEIAERQIRTLRCTACHVRDGQDDLFSQLAGEVAPLIADNVEDEPEGTEDEKIAPDQSIPALTWAGEKLKPEWTAQFLAGKLPYRLRPWLRARMPGFPARASLLAHALPLDHGFPPVAALDAGVNKELAVIGQKLIGKDGGFSCTACHGVGATKPVGVFEAPGVNFARVQERINKHYYDRWVYNPLRMVKETKMPSFADKDGKTSLRETLDGDARRQYEAIYHYLLGGEKILPPEN